jgi:hypothetical protein
LGGVPRRIFPPPQATRASSIVGKVLRAMGSPLTKESRRATATAFTDARGTAAALSSIGAAPKAAGKLRPAQSAPVMSVPVSIRNCHADPSRSVTAPPGSSTECTRHSPVSFQGPDTKGHALVQKVLQAELVWGSTPLFLRLRRCIDFWERHAPSPVVTLVKHGIRAPWLVPPRLPVAPTVRPSTDVQKATAMMQNYAASGAVRQVEWAGTKHLVPWFLLGDQAPKCA